MLSCTKLGSVIGVAEVVGDGEALGVDAGAVLADGGAVVALDAGGGAVQALKSVSSAGRMRVQRIRNMYSICDGKGVSASVLGDRTRTKRLAVSPDLPARGHRASS
jgi:hypothetical protein